MFFFLPMYQIKSTTVAQRSKLQNFRQVQADIHIQYISHLLYDWHQSR